MCTYLTELGHRKRILFGMSSEEVQSHLRAAGKSRLSQRPSCSNPEVATATMILNDRHIRSSYLNTDVSPDTRCLLQLTMTFRRPWNLKATIVTATFRAVLNEE